MAHEGTGMAHAKFGRFKIKLPRSLAARRALGGALCAGGALWFLPVVGLWMLPLSASLSSRRTRTGFEGCGGVWT